MSYEGAALLVGLLNTVELPDGPDALDTSTPEQWRADGLVDDGRCLHVTSTSPPPRRSDQRLRTLRDGLRALTRPAESLTAQQRQAISEAAAMLREVPLVVELDPAGGRPHLAPASGRDRAAARIAAVLDAYISAAASGDLGRIKTCARDECQWAFLDASRNRSRRWCDMRECGNLMKNREYRARRSRP